MFFTNITHGTKFDAKGGLVFSVGHTMFELSLVLVLAFTLQTVANKPLIRLVVGVVDGIALLLSGFLQIRDALKPKSSSTGKKETSLSTFFYHALRYGAPHRFRSRLCLSED